MRVGTLVKLIDDPEWLGIVLGRQGETTRWYVKWLTGVWQGEVGSRRRKELEVLCQ